MKRLARPASLLAGATVAFGAAVLRAAGPAPLARSSEPRAPQIGVDSIDLVLAATTDVHGRVRAWDYATDRPAPGLSLAAAASIIDSLRAAAPGRVLLVDAGDMLQGNPLAYVEALHRPAGTPNAIVAAMNVMRFDAAAIGNHEFDFGLPQLDRAVHDASFPLLAANAYRIDGTRAFAAWRIVDRAGLHVAIVGATTPGAMVWSRDVLRGHLVVRDLVADVRTSVGEARRAGADVVVVLLHSGLSESSSYDTTSAPRENAAAAVARDVPGIDAIVYGHTHAEVGDTVIGGAFLMQPKNYAASVGVAHLTVARTAGRWTVVGRRGAVVRTAGHADSPRVLAATQAAHDRTLRYIRGAVATTPNAWRLDSARVADTPAMDFVLETMRRAAGADLAANAAFSVDGAFGPGPVRLADVLRLYPYENTLRAVRVTGAQLRAYLEQSARYYRAWVPDDTASVVDPRVPGYNFDVVAGADYTLDLARPSGQRVTRLTVHGRPVADADTFTLALNNYRQTGGGGYAMLKHAPIVYDRGEKISDLLVAEARRRGVLRPSDYFQRNWELLPAAAAARAYAEMQPPTRVTKDAPASHDPTSPPRKRGPARLRIIATNDVHGALEPRADAQGVRRGGVGPMAAQIERARSECERPPRESGDCVSILLDGGDEFQGTPASNLAYGRPVVEVFRQLGLAASALGNHEFDWSVDTLRARIRQAPYAILGANVRFSDGSKVPWIRADTIVVRGGLRIGVVGLATTETPSTTRAANVKGLRFDSLAPVVDREARSLRQRGADVVIVIAHSGAFCDRPVAPAQAGANVCKGEIIDLANAVTEKIDAIVSGHTHSLVNTVVHGIPIVQARSSARAVGVIDIPLGADAPPAHVEVREVVADSAGPVPAAVDAIVRRAVAAVASRVDRRVAEIGDDMTREPDEQYALGNLIADSQRWAGKGDVAIMNNGGIRADLRRGTATYGSLFEIQPFGNTLYRITVRGRDLRTYLERLVGGAGRPRTHVSGLALTYDPKRPSGSRIAQLTMADGKPLDDDRLYAMILNDFLVTGGDGVDLAKGAAAVTPLNIVDLDALVGYLGTRPSPVHAPDEERLRATEATP